MAGIRPVNAIMEKDTTKKTGPARRVRKRRTRSAAATTPPATEHAEEASLPEVTSSDTASPSAAGAAVTSSGAANSGVTQLDVVDVVRAAGPAATTSSAGESKPRSRRPTRRGKAAKAAPPSADGVGKKKGDEEGENAPAAPMVESAVESAADAQGDSDSQDATKAKKAPTGRKRTRKRGRGRGKNKDKTPAQVEPEAPADEPSQDAPPSSENAAEAQAEAEVGGSESKSEEQASSTKKRRRSPSRRGATRARKEPQPAPDADEEAAEPQGTGSREMIINVSAGEECRIAVLHEGRLEELFIERASSQSHVGNIYKGRVTNVEPSIQAAFVDFGMAKNGFLHISDVQPQYFPNHSGEPEDVGRKIPRHHRPPIQKCFRRGQEVMVQITKEGVGTKGPTLTTYLSIPGRYIVMMPGMSRHGVSRKIEDEAARRTLRDLLNELTLPPGMGFIVRTAGLDHTKRELQRDLNYLNRLWKTVVERVKRLDAPAELYQESDLVTRTIRDVHTTDFRRIVVDDEATVRRARDFLQIAMPRTKAAVEHYTGTDPLFHHFGIEEEINRINSRHVPMRSGGSLVIDSTEALVAIDVNSGKFRSLDDAEETAFQIDLEAAEEIARQLRLRDLGGLIVCDFIDLRLDRHKRAVEKALRDALKKHKERARILRMSSFGLIEMTRQRQGPSVKRNIYSDCPHCGGGGLVKFPESVILDVMRFLQLAAHRAHIARINVTLSGEVAFQLLNSKRSAIHELEVETGKRINIRGDVAYTSDQVEYACEDSRGRPVTIDAVANRG